MARHNENPLLRQIGAMAEQKRVEPEVIISALLDEIETAARRRFENETLRARLNSENGLVELWAVKRIVKEVANPLIEMSVTEARSLYGDEAEIDMEVEFVRPIKSLLRTAMRIVKQRSFPVSEQKRARRRPIPPKVRGEVLKEFNHKCAVCGADRPHLHHIDEDPSNGSPLNLIPLCPNCHLNDQHDASNAIPRAKLAFFRRYKHRLILKPQFNGLLRRMTFLSKTKEQALLLERREFDRAATELVNFVAHLSMGGFYAEQMRAWFGLSDAVPRENTPDPLSRSAPFGQPPTVDVTPWTSYLYETREEFANAYVGLRPAIEALVVELLDYQLW